MSDQVQAQSVARQSKENKQQKIIEDLKRCSDETCLEDSHWSAKKYFSTIDQS